MSGSAKRILCLAGLLGLMAGAVPATAAAAKGPRLTASPASLQQSLACVGTLTGATRDPVLLVHGTFADAKINWSWNWSEYLPGRGQPACTVDLPDKASGDIQFAAQYVVYAIRTMAQASGRKVAIIGHSQGGLEPRWALRWWPDLRKLVSDVISFGTPQHGTQFTDSHCGRPNSCAAALYQMRSDSKFLRALNRGRQTAKGVPFTAVWSKNDQFVTPPREAAFLRGASNIGIQQVCPGRFVDHNGQVVDAAAFAIAVDALDHDGPARLARVDRSYCAQDTMPGVTREETNAVLLQYAPILIAALRSGGPRTKREPRLARYVTHR